MRLIACDTAPADWGIHNIESVCKRVTSGGTPSRKMPAYYQSGDILWVKTKELDDGIIYDTEEKITEEAIQNSSAKILPINTVLIAMYGATVGQLGILGKEATCNQACCALIVDESKADYRYIYYQLLAHKESIKSLATGAAQQNLSGVLIKSLTLPFPKVDEQKNIAETLWRIDRKIELNQRMNETLEGMARSIFKSWFVDFDPVHAKAEGRQPKGMDSTTAALFPSAFNDDGLPKGWDKGKIIDLCKKIESGGTPSRKEPSYWDDGNIPWLTSGEVRQTIVTKTENFITNSGLQNSSAKLWPPLTTVVAMYGATAGQVTLLACETTANQACCALLPESHTASYIFLKAMNSVQVYEGKASGSAQQNLNKSIVSDLETLIPPKEILEKFEEFVSNLIAKMIANEKQNQTLAALRDTLLPKLICGELRVDTATEKLKEAVA